MVVKLPGRVMLFRFLHPWKAKMEMLCTPSGKTMLWRLLQLKNAFKRILFVPEGT